MAEGRERAAEAERDHAAPPSGPGQSPTESGKAPVAAVPGAPADSPLLAEEPFRSFLTDSGPGVVAEMERYGAELAARHHGLADDPLCTFALAVLDGCGPPEGRSGLRADLAARAAGGGARPEAGGGADDSAEGGEPGCESAAARRAAVWRTLGDLLAREEGAPVDGPPPMFQLSRAMADGRRSPESDRFRLLHALHAAAARS
ncbi:hypothetical protein ACFW4X_34745 [Streptomyces smyrnaeus]|uniref:hypothetical protein n=1 Tax=Streptomyces smyrnaeus TaxID=1387713 RepID=UPI0036BC4A5D